MTKPVDAIYVHIPFCASLCPYCSFTSCSYERDDPAMAHYANSVAGVLDRITATPLGGSATTAYIGGGTPSYLGAQSLSTVVGALVRTAGDGLTELTVEANPDSFDADVASAAVAAGATRFSIGVQSFDDAALKALGRVHDAAAARAAVAAAVNTGARVSIDLICGAPGQTLEAFKADVRTAVESGVDHVSVYPLSIEEHTAFGDLVALGAMSAPDDDLQADMMEAAAAILEEAGLARYEVASYARPGFESQHNIAYWTGKSYLGLGLGASSMLDQEQWEAVQEAGVYEPSSFLMRTQRGHRVRLSPKQVSENAKGTATLLNSINLYDAAIPHLVDAEFLTVRQAVAEDLMLAMRMRAGAGAALLDQALEVAPGAQAVFESCVADGLAQWVGDGDDRRLAPTQRGWLLGNELFGRMWGLAGE